MEEIYRSQFRLPYGLYELLKASADENRRSVNAELISRLESAFSREEKARFRAGVSLHVPDDDEVDDYAAPADSHEISSRSLTTAIDKNQLTATPAEIALLSEDRVVAAMLRALRVLEDEKAWQAAQPSQGPKPRKRYPKA